MIRRWFGGERNMLFCVKLAAFALVTRFCLGAAYYYYFIYRLKTPVYAFDGEAYSIVGWYIALVLKGANVLALPGSLIPNDYAVVGGFFGTIASYGGSLPPIAGYGIGPYTYLVGAFYFLFGYAPVLLRCVNALMSVLAAVLAFDIGRRHFGERAGKIAFVAMLFNPSFIIYSISLQRDTLVNFLILAVVSCVLTVDRSADRRRQAAAAAIGVAAMALLSQLRINAASVLVIFIAVCCYVRCATAYRRLTAYATLAVFLFPPVLGKIVDIMRDRVMLMLKYHWGLTFLGGYTFRLLPDWYYASDASGEGPLSRGIGVIDLMVAVCRGVIAFLMEPSPFSMYKASHLIALPQTVLWYAVIAFGAVGCAIALRRSTAQRIDLIFLMCLFTVTIGLSEANTETLLRHRDMVVPIYILFAAVGYDALCGGKREAPNP